MSNPQVTRVKNPVAMIQDFRSTPMPAFEMRRPPEMWEEPLFRARWPMTGPYQGVSFHPFAFEPGVIPESPITSSEPLDNYIRNIEVDGLDQGEGAPVIWEHPGFTIIRWISGIASGYHGVQRNCGSMGWGIAWALGGYMLPVVMPIIAIAQGYGHQLPECPVGSSKLPKLPRLSGLRDRKAKVGAQPKWRKVKITKRESEEVWKRASRRIARSGR
jgi:hypothetical protein